MSTIRSWSNFRFYPAATNVFELDNLLRSGEKMSSMLQSVTLKQQESLNNTVSLFGPRKLQMTFSSDSNCEIETNVNLPLPWKKRLKYELEKLRAHSVCVDENVEIEDVIVPLVIRVAPRKFPQKESLIKRDLILWEILGDHESPDQKSPDFSWDRESETDQRDDLQLKDGMNYDEKKEIFNGTKHQQLSENDQKLIFTLNNTSMCFTTVEDVSQSIVRIGHLTQQLPTTEAMKIKRLRDCGLDVIAVNEFDFVKIENSEKELHQFLTKLLPSPRRQNSNSNGDRKANEGNPLSYSINQ